MPGRLQRHGADAGVMLRIIPAGFRHVVIQALVQFQSVVRLGPVAEHDRYGADHLHLDAEARVILDAHLRIPGFRPDFTEEFTVLVNTVPVVIAVVDDRKALVAILAGEIRPVAGQVVGVCVYFKHAVHQKV
jgi:hypothetical protein